MFLVFLKKKTKGQILTNHLQYLEQISVGFALTIIVKSNDCDLNFKLHYSYRLLLYSLMKTGVIGVISVPGQKVDLLAADFHV